MKLKLVKRIIAACLFVCFLVLILAVRGDYHSLQKKLNNLPLFSTFIAQRKNVINKAKTTTLNYYIPSFAYLASFINSPKDVFDRKKIDGYGGYLPYYQKAAEYMPQNAHVQGMLGFLHYHLGKTREALGYYKKAVELNPYYFWFPYNAGIISFKNENYQDAKNFFEQALKTNKEITIKIFHSSRFYQQIIVANPDLFHFSPEKRIEKGYQQCVVLLSFLNQYLNAEKPIPPLFPLHIYVF